MKKIHYLLLTLSILFMSILLIPFFSQGDKVDKRALWENYKVTEYELSGRKLRLIIAETDVKREKGLMYVKKPIEGINGMIFVFPNATQLSFWNKNTLMDLKLYWIKDKKVMGTSKLPSIYTSKNIVTVSSPGSVDTVIELY